VLYLTYAHQMATILKILLRLALPTSVSLGTRELCL